LFVAVPAGTVSNPKFRQEGGLFVDVLRLGRQQRKGLGVDPVVACAAERAHGAQNASGAAHSFRLHGGVGRAERSECGIPSSS
jgi:hypothetical protein